MKEVWFVSHYSMPPELEPRVKTLKYAEIMSDMGYKTKIFSASTIHNTDIDLIDGNEKYTEKTYGKLNFVHIKVPKYSGNGLSRILNLRKFSKRFNKIAKNFNKPDVIVSEINCINYSWIYKFCKKNGVKLYSDIRDLWPQSIVEYLGFSERNPIIKYLYGQEKRLYKVSNGVIFSMEGGKQYIINKGWSNEIDLSKVYYINNGVDIEMQDFQKNEFILSDNSLTDNSKFKIIYTGSIRLVNNINQIVDVAKSVKEKGLKDIRFLIYGEGEEKQSLIDRCIKEGIDNIEFKGFVDKKYIPYILSNSNLNIINVQQTDLVEKYGCSLNKMFDYLASGKPIVSNLKNDYDILEKYQCGITTSNQETETMVEAIEKIYNMPSDEYALMCENSIKAAQDFDFKILTKKLIDIIEE